MDKGAEAPGAAPACAEPAPACAEPAPACAEPAPACADAAPAHALAPPAAAGLPNLRYILGRVRAMCRHSPEEIGVIAQRLHDVQLCFHLRKYDYLQVVPPIFVGFHGFATTFERHVFLRVLKHATRPRVLHSTFLPGGAFEGFAILHPTTAAANVLQIEALFELFKMSAGVTDLGKYMSAPMVACIERVESGVLPYGNFRSLRAGNVRLAFAQAKQRRDSAQQLEHVRAETGLTFTTGNMLQIHYQLSNTQIELGQAFALLYRLRLLIGSMPLALDVPTVHATHVTIGPLPDGPPVMTLNDPAASVQLQYICNLRALIDSFVSSARPDAPVRVAVEVVDLTI